VELRLELGLRLDVVATPALGSRQTILAVVDAWIGLLGVLAGAAIALTSQLLLRRSEQRERRQVMLLDACSRVIALAEDFQNRIWEERKGLGGGDQVTSWNLEAYREAEVRVLLLSRSKRTPEALEELRQAGVELAKVWRLQRQEAPELEAAWRRHKKAITDLVSEASRAIEGSVR
jgi:gas vesicle protein